MPKFKEIDDGREMTNIKWNFWNRKTQQDT